MRSWGKASVAGLTLSLIGGTGWAAEICARPADLVALQVAALQQQLMVAALTCNDISLYNSFVITYQDDLVQSDTALQAFFDQFGNADGGPTYHAFKTKMANVYSAKSAVDKNRFCTSARASFAPALKAEKLNLASFAMSQPSTVNEPYTNCGEVVEGGTTVARTPVPLPAVPPGNLLTAQNAAAAAKGAAPPAVDPAGKPLAAGLRANSQSAPAPATPPPAAPPPVVQTPPNNAVASVENPRTLAPSNQATTPNTGQEQATTRYQQGRYASEAYRQRLAQQQQQRAQQRARLRYSDRYEARGHFWPADPYWEVCYTRYGARMSCAEAAERLRNNQLYDRAPYDSGGYYRTR